MGYLILALLLVTSSTAFATEDSLRTSSPYEFFDLFEDLYATPEQAEEAIDYFDVLSFSADLGFDELTELPGMSAPTAFRISRTDTLDWRQVTDRLNTRQSQLLTSLVARNSNQLLSLRSRMQADPLAREQRGYHNGSILGDQYRLYDRLMLSQYGLRAGMLQSKDPGEARTLDHVRGFLQMHQKQDIVGNFAIENAIIGDYSLGFGSGLLFSSGGMQGKSNEVIDAVEPKAKGIQAYLGSGVASGFRGAAATLSLGDLRGSIFYSNRRYDAMLDSGSISSIDLDGYHRTTSELAKVDSAGSTLIGSDLSYITKSRDHLIQLGVTGFSEVFSLPVQPSGFVHNFRGRSLDMLSQYGAFIDSTMAINYEIAYSRQQSTSAAGGALSLVYEASRTLQFSMNARYLPQDLVSGHGSAFGESTDDAQNERGVYIGVRYLPSADLTLSSYADLSGTFAPPYLAENNFRTTDLMLLAEYELARTMKLTWRTRWKRKSDEERLEGSRALGSRDQLNSRIEHEWQPLENFRMRNRGEVVHVGYNNFQNSNPETGFIISSAAQLKLFDAIAPELRVTWFNTPSYDSRLYVYENDLPGASGLTMLYGAGIRYAGMLRVQAFEGISLAAKYGITVYSREREFGSSFTSRTGKTSSKMGFQLDVEF